jgi:glycosyltransferase involved in cell wall biosynthesis
MTAPRPLRICVIASSRFPIVEPFAGGLEAHTHALVSELRRRGHDVALFAAPGSDPDLDVLELSVAPFSSSETARADIAAPPEWWMREHHAYLELMLGLTREPGRFDVVHNNSLHHLPIAMAPSLDVPVVTTLHTPPVPWLESAIGLAGGLGGECRFVAVSDATRRQWAPRVAASVVHNGVDPERWPAGRGGRRAVWSGRLVPEKAPHEAVRAALLAGVPLDLVGPLGDRDYVAREVEPHLGDPDDPYAPVRYLGHLDQRALSEVVGAAAVAVVTPAWEEPFGLVAAEAMCSGTPVAAVARGALPELVSDTTGRLAAPGDVEGLAAAIREAAGLDRAAVREEAVARFGLAAMVDAYERVYRDVVGRVRAA